MAEISPLVGEFEGMIDGAEANKAGLGLAVYDDEVPVRAKTSFTRLMASSKRSFRAYNKFSNRYRP